MPEAHVEIPKPLESSAPAGMSPRAAGVLFIVFGTLLWSTGGVGVKWLTGEGMPAWSVSAWRSALAAVVFFVAVRGRIAIPRGPGSGWFWLGAITYAYVVTGFVLSTWMTSAANAIILQDTMPLWVLLLSRPMLGEHVRPRDLAAVAIGFVGVVLCLGDGFAQPREAGLLSRQTFGDLLALSTGVAFGLTTICMRHTNTSASRAGAPRTAPAVLFLFWGNVMAAIAGWVMAGVLQSDAAVGASAGAGISIVLVLVVAWLGFGQLGTGYLTVQHGLRSVPAFQASMLMLIEPVLNPFWVAVTVGEIPGAGTIAGGVLVLGAMMFALSGRR